MAYGLVSREGRVLGIDGLMVVEEDADVDDDWGMRSWEKIRAVKREGGD
jgi:hypothetical protein